MEPSGQWESWKTIEEKLKSSWKPVDFPNLKLVQMARVGQFFELQQFTSKLSLKWPWTFRRYNYAFLAQSGHWGSFWALYVRLFTNSKKWSKKFFWPKMVEFGSVEISEPPKSTILGWGGWYIFSPHQRGSKALVKSFSCWPNHFGTP